VNEAGDTRRFRVGRDYMPIVRLCIVAALLSTALALGCGSSDGVARPTPAEAVEPAPLVSGQQARRLVAEGAVLLDVRSSVEYAVRHIDGAINVPVGDLEARADELDPDRPVVVYCLSGHRSANAGRILKEKGFAQVYDLGSMVSY
jgi:rhodanese-related sulfurtransferase